MDVGVVSEKAFLRSMEEVGSVVDARLLARGAAKDLGLPCIASGSISTWVTTVPARCALQMAIKVDDAHRAVFTRTLLASLSVLNVGSQAHRLMERSRGSVMVWSPPRVISRGKVLPFLEKPGTAAFVCGFRFRR